MSNRRPTYPGGRKRERPYEGGFQSTNIGGNLYEFYPHPVRFITGTGFLVDTIYEIPKPFRLNKVELTHTDANQAPTGEAWIADLHLEDKATANLWRPIFERAVTMTTILLEMGVEYNWRGRRIRIRTSAPLANLIYPMFTVQYLEGVPYNG